MKRVLFVSHTAEKGGAELFLGDVLDGGPAAWRAAFLSEGPMVDDLASKGRLAFVISGARDLLKIKRGGGSLRPAAILSLLKTARLLGRQARNFDVICANSQKALFVCAIASVLIRRPLVWILHDILTDDTFSSVNRRAAVFLANVCARRVTANSQAVLDAFVASGGRRGHVGIVYNGFDVGARPRANKAAGEWLRADLGLDGRPIVGLFGRLTEWKGQHVLLEALLRLPDVQAILVGGPLFGEEAYEATLRERVAALGLENRVRFMGFRSDVAELMAGVDVLVHTSTRAEPFGRVIVEGQLAGLPVVAADGGGVREIVEHGATGLLVPPSDPVALAEALYEVIYDSERRESLALAGFGRAAERFDIERTRRDLERQIELI